MINNNINVRVCAYVQGQVLATRVIDESAVIILFGINLPGGVNEQRRRRRKERKEVTLGHSHLSNNI